MVMIPMSFQEQLRQRHYRDCEKRVPSGHYADLELSPEVVDDGNYHNHPDVPWDWESFGAGCYPDGEVLDLSDDQRLFVLLMQGLKK